MYKKDYSFHTPDKSLTIWRYLDFTKFVDLLISNKLFFARSDRFQDPFEDIFKLKDEDLTTELFTSQKETKKFYFLNCWHINNNQSDAMWKIFLDTKNGIAIKTTIDNLIKSIENSNDDVYISKVYYRDYENVSYWDLISEDQNKIAGGRGSSINQFNYKRISFEHEKELRLFYIDLPIPHVITDGIPREPLIHKQVDVDLNILISEVVIAPFADLWFKDLVQQIILKLNFDFPVLKSNLYEPIE